MSEGNRFDNKIEDLGGKAKEAAGKVTGDNELQGEGKADQVKASLKDAVEDAKDAVGGAAEKLKGAFKKD